MTKEKTKILMYGNHVAYIDRPLMQAFDHHCSVVNFSAWIRIQAKNDFGLIITSKDDLYTLDEAVLDRFYTDKSEWLRDKIRCAIKPSQST